MQPLPACRCRRGCPCHAVVRCCSACSACSASPLNKVLCRCPTSLAASRCSATAAGECDDALHDGMYACPAAARILYKDTYNAQVQMRCQCAVDGKMTPAPQALRMRRHARRFKARTTASIAPCLLVVLFVAALVGSAQAYACTSNADCEYPGCNDRSCSYDSLRCNNGVSDFSCVSTTAHSETQCHSSAS